MSTWRDGDVIRAKGRHWPPSRGALGLGGTVLVIVGIIVAGILTIGKIHGHGDLGASSATLNGSASTRSGPPAHSRPPSHAQAAGGTASQATTKAPGATGAPKLAAAQAKTGGAGLTAPSKASSAPATSSATATSSGSHRLVAEVRDPEEARSFPAPASVHHGAAKTPQAAGEAQVAQGAASDTEIRNELAKMKQLERSASAPTKMATVPGGDSIVGNDGAIAIPSDVPEVIQRVIAGANAIANFPYRYGGGHASFVDNAYDCSGSVSYALAAGGLLGAPETSGQLESWGAPGPGKWITVYANAGHTYMYVNVGGAWMLYDTAGRSGVLSSRWQPYPVDNAGYVARHWPGL